MVSITSSLARVTSIPSIKAPQRSNGRTSIAAELIRVSLCVFLVRAGYRSGCARLSLLLQFSMEKADLVRTREVLKKQTWLHGHGVDLVEPLLAHGRLVSFEAGQWTHAEGDEETGILVVIRGLVYVLCKAPGDREVLIGPTAPGGAIGQTTRFGGGPRLVTVQCMNDSLILLAPDRVLTDRKR